MSEEQLLEEEVSPKEKEDDLLGVEGMVEGDEDQDEDIDTNQDRLMAMMVNMNDTITSFCDRLSRVEAAQKRPPAKKRRIEEQDNNLSEAESDISGSHKLTDNDQHGEAPNPNTSVAEDNLLNEIAQDFAEVTPVGDDVCQKLADIINQRWASKLDEQKLKSKMEKYSRPKNCEKLTVPRVNEEIWNTLNHATRGTDLKLVNFQKTLVKVGVALAKSTDTLLAMRAKQTTSEAELKQQLGDLVTYNTDALALLGHTHVELLTRRRELIKPNLNKVYYPLCSPQTPITEELFGNDLQGRLASIKASNKISQAATTSQANFDKSNTRRPFSDRSKYRFKGKSFVNSGPKNSNSFLWQNRGNNRPYLYTKPKFVAGKRKGPQ